HLDLEDEVEDYWLEHERQSPLQRWMGALREVVLPRLADRRPTSNSFTAESAEGSEKVGEKEKSQRAVAGVSPLLPSSASSAFSAVRPSLVVFIDEIDA